MATTQEHISIEDVRDGLVLLKDGGASMVIQTSAVNFGLLSEDEQIAIIDSFAQMLNSLSFAIEINILSRRLDISSYIKLLDKSLSLQTNPLMAQLMINYRTFVQSLIKDNEVLDKSFFIAVNVSRLEMGIGIKNLDERLKKAKTVLGPRRDQVVRQLNRIGLKSNQLNNTQIIKLFYELYNPTFEEPKHNPNQEVSLNEPSKDAAPPVPAPVVPPPVPIAPMPRPVMQPLMAPQQLAPSIQTTPLPPLEPQAPAQPQVFIAPDENNRGSKNHPFVVEELKE